MLNVSNRYGLGREESHVRVLWDNLLHCNWIKLLTFQINKAYGSSDKSSRIVYYTVTR